MADANSVIIKEDTRGNGRKKLLVIGKTGTGKSSLCNRIVGCQHDAEVFPVSAASDSCTQETVFADAFFNGDKSYPFTVIDTIGFDDPTKDKDALIIAELVDKLKNDCDHVNLFAIAVNGQNPRLDGSLLGMIKIFEGMFTNEFWNQVVIIFTRMPMDKKAKSKREKTNKETDDDLAKQYMKSLEEKFKDGKNLRYLFLDATFDEEDEDEHKAFTEAMAELSKYLESAPALPTVNVTEVETETAALKREIKIKTEEREKMEEMLREQMESIKQVYSKKIDKLEQQMKVDEEVAAKAGKMKDEMKADYERMMRQAEADKQLHRETVDMMNQRLKENEEKMMNMLHSINRNSERSDGGCIIL